MVGLTACECSFAAFDERGLCTTCGGRVDGVEASSDEERACNLANGVLAVIPRSPNQLEQLAELLSRVDATEAVRARARTLVAAVVESDGNQVNEPPKQRSRLYPFDQSVESAPRPRGVRVAAALERALRNAPEAKTYTEDAVIVFDVLRRWYGDGARDVLRAALELAEVAK